MHFRQQRRRRVWPDEASAANAAQAAPPPTAGPAGSEERVETYTAQARRDAQLRLTDLIPIRYRVLALLSLVGACLLALLEGLYARLDWLAGHVAREALGAFDLANRGSFAAWYSSLLLSLTAVTAGLLFSLRRHRIDDYRGRYRIWIWVVLGLLALAINQTSHLDDLVRQIVVQIVAAGGYSPAWLWWALCIGVSSACLARLSFEMRPSRASLALVWLGAGEWLLSASGNIMNFLDPATQLMFAVGLKILGQLTILAAHVAYARYVLLDAHGLLPVRAARPKAKAVARSRKRKAEKIEAAGPRVESPKPGSLARTDLDPPATVVRSAASTNLVENKLNPAPPKTVPLKPVSAKSGVMLTSTESAEDDGGIERDDLSDDRGLSRAERKRLRRERKLDKRNAA